MKLKISKRLAKTFDKFVYCVISLLLYTFLKDSHFYIHLQSNELLNYFSYNKPGKFTCMLAQNVHLNDRWYVGIAEFEYNHKITKQPLPLHPVVPNTIYKDSIVGDKSHQLFRFIPLNKKAGQRIFDRLGHVHYYLVNKQTIDPVEISINVPGYLIDQVLDRSSDQPVIHFTNAPPLVL